MKYSIVFKESVRKELTRIPHKELQAIDRKILVLADNPRPPGCKKLASEEKWRIRAGNYRIIYEIDNKEIVITIIRIGHRKDVYR